MSRTSSSVKCNPMRIWIRCEHGNLIHHLLLRELSANDVKSSFTSNCVIEPKWIVAVTCSYYYPTLKRRSVLSPTSKIFSVYFQTRSDRKKCSHEKSRRKDSGIFVAIRIGLTSTCDAISKFVLDILIVFDLWCGLKWTTTGLGRVSMDSASNPRSWAALDSWWNQAIKLLFTAV